MINPLVMPKRASPSSKARWMPLITVSKGTPRSVWVCGSKKISAWRTPWLAARVRYAQVRS